MLLKEKTQRFTCAVTTSPSLEMVQDSHLLREVVYNLLVNAFRYTPADGEITFSVTSQNEELLFSVKDTGYGIPKRDYPRIFERMFRASNVKQKFPGGTGFGLYIAKLFVERSTGRIWFESEENKGTTFYIALPLGAQQ
jgi:two-component system sensor histidine kinase VicK